MAEVLTAYLEREAARPSAFWGERDCYMFVCNWVRLTRGVDPATRYRGQYSTELGCLRLLKRDGGLEAIMDSTFASVGIHRTGFAKDGDAVMISQPALQRGAIVQSLAAAIFYRGKAVAMMPNGMLFLSTPVLAAWAV